MKKFMTTKNIGRFVLFVGFSALFYLVGYHGYEDSFSYKKLAVSVISALGCTVIPEIITSRGNKRLNE